MLTGRRRLYRVSGDSMRPTLHPDHWIWVALTQPQLPNVDDLVMVTDPATPSRLLVKRVRSKGQATFSVGSDNPLEGRDSRHFGSLSPEQLHGYVIACIDTAALRESRWLRK